MIGHIYRAALNTIRDNGRGALPNMLLRHTWQNMHIGILARDVAGRATGLDTQLTLTFSPAAK